VSIRFWFQTNPKTWSSTRYKFVVLPFGIVDKCTEAMNVGEVGFGFVAHFEGGFHTNCFLGCAIPDIDHIFESISPEPLR